MRDLTLDNITGAVLRSIDGTQDRRLKELLTVFIHKAHEAVRETGLTHAEWLRLTEFLRRTGEATTAQRNEFILMSDVFGITSLVDLLSAAGNPEATDPSPLGPFYLPDAPMLPVGRVLSASGDPVPGALMEFWQNAANGLYSNTDPEQDDDNLRCRMVADADGSYSLSTIRSIAYEVLEDGTGCEFVRATGRHRWRPAHLHVRVQAARHKPLVTEVFNAQDQYIEEDAVFGVRASLAVRFDREPTADERARFGHVATPFHMVDFDFVMQPAG